MEVGAPLHTIPGSGSPSPCVDRRSLEDKSSNKQHCAKNRACGAAGELSAEKIKEIFFPTSHLTVPPLTAERAAGSVPGMDFVRSLALTNARYILLS